jgi:hypothetical protein
VRSGHLQRKQINQNGLVIITKEEVAEVKLKSGLLISKLYLLHPLHPTNVSNPLNLSLSLFLSSPLGVCRGIGLGGDYYSESPPCFPPQYLCIQGNSVCLGHQWPWDGIVTPKEWAANGASLSYGLGIWHPKCCPWNYIQQLQHPGAWKKCSILGQGSNSVVEHLPSMHAVLGSIPNTAKRKKKEEKEREKRRM